MADYGLLQEERKALPIYPYPNDLLGVIENQQVLVIVGEAGSGKTTQVPQYLHEAGYTKQGKIACTQSRELPAISAAARVSQEMGTQLGDQVGYCVGFDDCTSEQTLLKYMTDGTLLRELLANPDLAGYCVVMVDEAHERTLNTDILLSLMKDISRSRPDLKLLISSGLLNSKKFSDYFEAPVFKISGRRYPLEIHHSVPDSPDYLPNDLETIADITLGIHRYKGPGGILIFLCNQEDIEILEEMLSDHIHGPQLAISKVHANLPFELLTKIFETTEGARKIVLATDIAETSLAVNGISYVVDPGFWIMRSYNPSTKIECLEQVPISKASAMQRAGRSCRIGLGTCYRLCTERTFLRTLDDNTVPEIQRTKLGNIILILKCLRFHDWVKFNMMDPPPHEAIVDAMEVHDWIKFNLMDPSPRKAIEDAMDLLYALGALGIEGELTRQGRQMAEFPLDPMLSKTIIGSERYGCSNEIITIAAILSTGNSIFCWPNKREHANNAGDHITLLKVYSTWKANNYSARWCHENYVHIETIELAKNIRDHLERILKRVGINTSSNSNCLAIKKSILSGFFSHSAQLQTDGSSNNINTRDSPALKIHPRSELAQFRVLPKFVVYDGLEMKADGCQVTYMTQVTAIDPNWLIEIAPHCYKIENGEITLRTGARAK